MVYNIEKFNFVNSKVNLMNHALKILTFSKTDVGCTGLSEM